MVETLRKRKKKVSRTNRRGGGVNLFKARASSDYFLVNNHKIPDEIAVNRYILNNLFGLNGKILQLPYPGEIFYANTDRDIQSAYVCVQSCISGLKSSNEFNVLQQFISKGAAKEHIGEISVDKLLKECNLDLYNKHLSLSYINYVIRAGMSPNSAVFKAYKDIIDMNKNKKIDLNSSIRFTKVYDTIKKIIDKLDLDDISKLNNAYTSNYVVYGIPLIKYTPEMLKNKLCEPRDVIKSQRVIPFLLKDIRNHIRIEGIQQKLKDNLKKSINFDQEDSYNNRFGVLDLEDNNMIPYSKTYKDAGVLLKEAADIVHKTATGDTSPEDTTVKETLDDEDEEREKAETKTDEEGDETKTDEEGDETNTGEEGDEPAEGETGDVESKARMKDVIKQIKENYESFEENNTSSDKKLSRSSKKANEIIKMIFPTDDEVQRLINENKIELYNDFIIVSVETRIKAVKEGGKNAVGNLYKLKGDKIIKEKSTSRLGYIREALEYTGRGQISKKIVIIINPTKKGRYIRVSYVHNQEEFLLSVFSEKNEQRISIEDSRDTEEDEEASYEESTGGGMYTRRIRKKTLRKRYSGGGIRKKLSKGAVNLFKDVRTLAKKTKKKLYDNLFTGQFTSGTLSWLRKWTSTRMVDIEMRRKNWNFRVGDTFLWLGNEYLYKKWQTTTRELKSLGLINETYLNTGTRETTFLDSNTFNRLPIKGSYCTIIGYGTDILYASNESGLSDEERASKNEIINKLTEYKNVYKHGNLLNGTTPKLLLYDRITSRIIREDIATKMKNPDSEVSQSNYYEWAHYEKDEDLYNEKGKNVDDFQKREKTPNKSCYYIIESKPRSHLPSKICKVYADELQLWGQNYSRFSSLLRRLGRKIKGSLNLRNSLTTQEDINVRFKEALKNWDSELNILDRDKYSKTMEEDAEQAGGGPDILDIVDTGEALLDQAQDTLQGNVRKSIDSSGSGKYGPQKEAKILDHFPFIRSLPATLYAYITDYIINHCKDKDDDPVKMLETFKNQLSKSNVVDENIFYRYGSHIENFEIYYHYYFSKKDIRNILKLMGQSNDTRKYRLIPRMFKDINGLQTEERNNFDVFYNSVINNSDKYRIEEKKKIRDIRSTGINNERIYNFFPNIYSHYSLSGEETPKKGGQITKYLEDIIQNNMSITDIRDINKYGIDMLRWINKNNAYANNFVETDRATYISIPSLLNITPNKEKEKGQIELYSLGYYVFIQSSNYSAESKGSGNQSLFWHDRHISIENYKKSIESFPEDIHINQRDISEEEEKLNIIQEYLHAPIIFIVNRGRVYIPPIFYCISEVSLSFMKSEVKKINLEWSMVEFKADKDNSDTNDSIDPIDIREYCINFIDGLKSKNILYVKNVNLPNTSESLDANSKRFAKFDNIHFNQYNSRKRVLPVTTTALDQARMIPWMNSLNKLSNDEGYIGEIDKKLEIKPSGNKPLNRIFGGLQTIESSGMEFYDYEHIKNAIKYMQDIDSQTGTSTASSWWQKSKEVVGKKISMEAIKRLGSFTGGSLFFQDKDISKNNIDKSVDNVNFFKYLFFKYSLDMNIFKEWGKPTFIRWKKTQEQGSTLVLEPNMIMRLNNQKCIRMYNYVQDMRNTVIYSFLKKIKVEMEKNKSMKFEGILDSTIREGFGFAKSLAKSKIRQKVQGEQHLTVDQNVNYEGQPPSFISDDNEVFGGTRKTRKKNKYRKMKRTGKKLRRTGKKLRRTNQKMKRTDKKNKKKTGKKRVYNP